jgi:hypothetical protein
MKVRCRECGGEMEYPFEKCGKCGWIPRGKHREMAKKFARKYVEKGEPNHRHHRSNRPKKAIIITEPQNWRLTKEPGEDPKVKCYKCRKLMDYPYLECTECGWIARKEMRKRAREFSEIYIDAHRDNEDNLRIIWDEENHRLKKR